MIKIFALYFTKLTEKMVKMIVLGKIIFRKVQI